MPVKNVSKKASAADVAFVEEERSQSVREKERGKFSRSTFMLEVARELGQAPLRLLGTVRSFTAGEMTLAITGSAPWVDWERLAGLEALLHEASSGSEPQKALKGKVVRARGGHGDFSPPVVSVALANLNNKQLKILEEQLLRRPLDTKVLYQRLDKAQNRATMVQVGSQALYLFGLSVIALGLAVRAWNPYTAGKLPIFLIIGGVLVSGTKLLWSLARKC